MVTNLHQFPIDIRRKSSLHKSCSNLAHVLLTLFVDSFYKLEISFSNISLYCRLIRDIYLNPIAVFIVKMLNTNISMNPTAVFTRGMLAILYIALYGILSMRTLERNSSLVLEIAVFFQRNSLTSSFYIYSGSCNQQFASLTGLMECLEPRIHYLHQEMFRILRHLKKKEETNLTICLYLTFLCNLS